jgi:hypothetical protein
VVDTYPLAKAPEAYDLANGRYFGRGKFILSIWRWPRFGTYSALSMLEPSKRPPLLAVHVNTVRSDPAGKEVASCSGLIDLMSTKTNFRLCYIVEINASAIHQRITQRVRRDDKWELENLEVGRRGSLGARARGHLSCTTISYIYSVHVV